MKVIESLETLWQTRKELTGPVGLVPTMGYLHDGHLELVRQAKKQTGSVVVSIFVNPTQFGPGEDLESYPQDLDRDLTLLKTVGADLVWTPTTREIYPPGYQTWVETTEVTQPLEGSYRPSHFKGVTTIVAKLFNAVRPDLAFFGQKDAQQAAVIQQMTRDLNYPIKIVVVPTVREPDGLARSSRNTYLDAEERKAASVLYRALRAAESAYLEGERSGAALRSVMAETIKTEPLAETQYVSCADRGNLHELDRITDGALLSIAVYLGSTRLIDNWILE